MLLMGIRPSRSDKLMVESERSAFAKGLLGRNNNHLLVFLTPNIIFTSQLEKDIELRLRISQYLSPADQ